ncbi:MAG: hypothetical protein MST10_01270 [Lentisphaeria bacterium]|nr:hypothetical protein [Lentisphaeria bacterium]
MKKLLGLFTGLLLITAANAAALKFEFDQLFGSNAVLQRNLDNHPIWGNAPAGSVVEVTFRGVTRQTQADGNGKWQVRLPSGEAGGPFQLVATCNEQKIISHNIAVGEVWLVAGQSNADYPLRKFQNGEIWAKDAEYPQIRYLKQTWQPPHLRAPDLWRVCSKDTALAFSATGFFFAKGLTRDIKMPVGIIVGAADGSVIARWISREALEKIPDAKKNLLEPYDRAVAKYPEVKKQYDAEVERRLALPAEAKSNLPDLKMPIPPTPMSSSSFDAIIKPIIPFPIKGVIWYQGESNAMFSQGYQYRFYLEGLINEFRELWQNPQMPFIVVEIPRYQQTYVWADLRDSQKFVADNLKNVFLVTILELGELKEIHPPRKPEMAERLVLSARKNVYGEKDLIASGPVYKSMKIVGKTIEIEFDSLGDGLVSNDNMPLREFTIAGADKKFYPAKAQIVGEKVVVSSERVAEPKAVRYAWRDAVDVNLFNRNGLSAGQFRTDNWKIPTQRD